MKDNSNITLIQDDVEIYLRLRNKTINAGKRKKRQALKQAPSNGHKRHVTFDESKIWEARRIIKEHNMHCNEQNHKEVCKDLIQKLEKLTKNDKTNIEENKSKIETSSTEINKRETVDQSPEKSLEHIPVGDDKSLVQNKHPHDKHITSCILGSLLKKSYPQPGGVNDDSDFNRASQPLQYSRYVSPYLNHPVYKHGEIGRRHGLHPQDVEIAMQFLSKSEPSSKEVFNASLPTNTNCAPGTTSCLNGEACIDNSKLCDGMVDCTDVSDEARCSCKSRVDKSRICDGYFDCPFGEDEMGCNGCKENMFSCEDPNERSRIICFSKEQRCDNVADCPNRKDEIDCSLLTPSLHNKPLFPVSNIEGFLHRNYKGTWYPVCKNPYMWAHDACRRETGLIIRPPYFQLVDIDPLKRIKYINTGPGGFIHTSKTCFNSSAVYVTCATLLCGTRMPSAGQLLDQNIDMESDLYGRNKRFSFNRPFMFLGNRYKRHVGINNDEAQYQQKLSNSREKRTDVRVVGGIPSQPAAWPWVAALYRDGMFHCGGVILNQHWVMSAAHCVHKFWQHYYEIQVGMLRRFSFSPQEQNHRVTHVIVNQNYNQEDMKNDLALLRVRPAIQFSRWVRPICLPGPETAGPNWREEPKPGTICTAIGWGATVERGLDPDHLREVEVPIWSHCKHKQDEAGKEICAGLKEGGKDTCQGDSGGPLLCTNPINIKQWYVAGIVSHGDGCARENEPGVYTRVSIFVDWIKFHIFSKDLPTIQPKHNCPGFRCESGITKCLPKKRICDGIIDCLSGEDELNCDLKTLPEKKRETSQKEDVASFVEQENNEIVNKQNPDVFITTISDKEISSDISEKGLLNYTTTTLSAIQDISNSEKNELNFDFNHASTIEMITDSASEETVIKHTSNEYATLDPIIPQTTELILETNTLSINTPKNIFESVYSQMKEKNKTENDKDITEPFTTSQFANSAVPEQATELVFESNETSQVTNGIETLQVHSAKGRKTFEVPSKFECRRMYQNISFDKRCDHIADCEDGTDEQDCTCVDYLFTLHKNLICDGNFDCLNGLDELDCFACEENEYLCKKSKLCLPSNFVCNGEVNCPDGEDEEDCFALSNGKDIIFDFDGRPELRLDGYVSVRHKNNWHIFCEDNLTFQQQEQKANDICQYLGFSSANRYLLKYLNVNEEKLMQIETDDKRNKRNTKSPIHFTYLTTNIEDNAKSEMFIQEPEVLKERCVPNVTKTCMTVYVYCDQSLFTNFNSNQALKKLTEHNTTIMWPWIAKIYVDGVYKCTGVLVDLSWVVISDSCLWNTIFSRQFVSVVLGSHKTLSSTSGPYEQVFRVDFKKDLYLRKVTILHLNGNATYSSMVKPMSITQTYIPEDNQKVCIAIGEDGHNKTISIFLNETSHNCFSNNRCFMRSSNSSICAENVHLQRPWSGIISCHTNLGWYPAASFVDSRGECGLDNTIIGTDIGNIKNEIKLIKDTLQQSNNGTIKGLSEDCNGQRCGRGKCINLRNICDGIRHCEDGKDESYEACYKKKQTCTLDPLHNGCDCTTDQLKCQNGECIPKEYFRDGKKDCEDGSDEPGETTCADYLGRVMPSRLCDGVLHCHDRSDENPKFCKCFAKNSFRCGRNFEGSDSCVAMDMVCDGINDCPNGEDEKKCIGLSAPPRTPYGTGKVIVRSHGVWYTKCYNTKVHTKSDLEAICRQLGFISGHAKQLSMPEKLITTPHNKYVVDSFNEIVFNNKTKIKLRNTNAPIAKAVIDDLEDCIPVFIECL
ncbi:Serine protease nudel [Papilio machaon]|uniref:Serine protease nudel n=1 Tax=Papilio machaon TaxID=76193 RepID=A0A194RQA2_PAPMA|nr:Serine protease nudel [Papilio machaon]